MALFDYTGQLPSGTAFHGTLEAEHRAHAEAILVRLGVRVTTLRPVRRTGYVTPLSLDELTFFSEQLSSLSKAGLPLEEGLRQVAADVGSRRLKRLLVDLADDLETGTPLTEALARQKARFPAEYPGVIEAALQTGDLGGTLYGLTTHLRLKSSARRMLVELAAYPLMILTLTLFVTAFVMRVVIPGFRDLTQELAGEMAGWTGTVVPSVFSPNPLVLAVDVWPTIEAILAGLLGAGALAAVLISLPKLRRVREWLLRRIPGVAQVYWSSVLARFAHTSALGAFAGAPLPQLLVASGQASGSRGLTDAAGRIAERVAAGEPLTEAARNEPDVPGLWTCAVAVAGPRGDLPAVLAEIARTYELRAQHWVNTLRAILGPVLLLLVALCVGGIIVIVFGVLQLLLRQLMGVSSLF